MSILPSSQGLDFFLERKGRLSSGFEHPPGKLVLNAWDQYLMEGCVKGSITPGRLDVQRAELCCKSADRLEPLSQVIQAGVSLHLAIRVTEGEVQLAGKYRIKVGNISISAMAHSAACTMTPQIVTTGAQKSAL